MIGEVIYNYELYRKKETALYKLTHDSSDSVALFHLITIVQGDAMYKFLIDSQVYIENSMIVFEDFAGLKHFISVGSGNFFIDELSSENAEVYEQHPDVISFVKKKSV